MNKESNDNKEGDHDSGRPPLPMKTPSKDKASQLNMDNNPLGISPPGMRLRSGTKKPPTPMKAGATPAMTTTRKKRRRSEDDGTDEGSHEGGRHEEMFVVKRSRATSESEDVIVQEPQHENQLVEQNYDVVMKEKEHEHDPSNDELVVVEDKTPSDQGESTAVEKINDDAMEKNKSDDVVDQLVIAPAAAQEVTTLESSKDQSMTDDHAVQENPVDTIFQQPSTPTPRMTQPVSVEGLKLPSQHTPAPRNLSTATYEGRNKMKDFMTPANVVLRRDDEILSGDGEKESSSSVNGTDSEMERLQLKMVQGDVEVREEEEERDDGRRDGLFHYMTDQEQRHQTVKTGLLVSALVALHAVMGYLTGHGFLSLSPMWVWSDMPQVANCTLELYRYYGLIAPPPEPIKVEPKVVERIVNKTIFKNNLELAKQEKEKRINRKRIDWWKSQKAEVEKISDEYGNLASEYLSELKKLHDTIAHYNTDFASKEEMIVSSKRMLGQAETILSGNGDEKSTRLNAILRDLEKVSNMQINVENVNVIEPSKLSIPGEQCSGKDFILEASFGHEEFATVQEIEQARSHLMTSTLSEIKTKQDLYRPIAEWIEQEFHNHAIHHKLRDLSFVDDIQPVIKKEMESSAIDNLDAVHIQDIIDKEIEKLKADATGKHDYASLRSGASVINDGPLATSPSLVQNLPLGNQLMSKLGLRFYGHGPDAALEPTFPKDSLGQCWSFEKEGVRKRITIQEWNNEEIQQDPNRGSYATLAVKLARPIQVTEVSIEHVPKAVSSNRDTAIKNFRVIGFEDEDAIGYPWLLVESQYNSQSDALQEYQVQTELPDGIQIPPVASVVLAIDDNWGAEYSCLYRFRVHGTSD
mmetsp:Transcript_4423/g.8521  ORF Transcript_4423/g.8521 Transcript_4423/m.8521 type:complete len:864 (-) Transcript_4423:1701-4292(-)